MSEKTAAKHQWQSSRSVSPAAAHAPPRLPAAAHVLFGMWITAMVLLGKFASSHYESLLQEDRLIEWWTVPLFAGAGVFALHSAWRRRRLFDVLVGAFCIFVAGEEFSWGQRLLGLTPPAAFLEHNFQQELTLHNFADIFGQPKWVLIGALAGFGVLLPIIARSARAGRVLDHIGATVPRTTAVPWFVAAIVLLVWYPLSYTGEWVETLAGALFLVTFASRPRRAGAVAGAGALLALALTAWSGRGTASPAEIACAQIEAEAIAEDLAYGRAATARMAGASSVHKRVFTAVQDGYIEPGGLLLFRDAACPGDGAAADRRQHAIDPWGAAYWISMERGLDTIALRVYSFGPNRRRDGGATAGSDDDIGIAIVIRP